MQYIDFRKEYRERKRVNEGYKCKYNRKSNFSTHKKQYLARIQENSEHTFYQPLSEHLQHVSSLIEVNSSWKEMQSAKKLVALLHDGGKVETRFDNAMQMQENFYNNAIDKEECSTLVVQAVIETIKLYRKCGYFARSQKKQCGSLEFYFGMAERMLISSLMDSDWMDAATCADQRFDQVLANAKACTDWEPLDQAFNVKLEDTENKADDTPLNRCRSYISDECCRAADTDYMRFRLGTPTGSGKTMSSLRFALTRAKKQHAKRIFLQHGIRMLVTLVVR